MESIIQSYLVSNISTYHLSLLEFFTGCVLCKNTFLLPSGYSQELRKKIDEHGTFIYDLYIDWSHVFCLVIKCFFFFFLLMISFHTLMIFCDFRIFFVWLNDVWKDFIHFMILWIIFFYNILSHVLWFYDSMIDDDFPYINNNRFFGSGSPSGSSVQALGWGAETEGFFDDGSASSTYTCYNML